MKKTPTYMMTRELPGNAKVVKVVNGIELYNINVYQNIMSWNQHNLDVPVFDYEGHIITYRDLPKEVDSYSRGFLEYGIGNDTVVTISLPVSIEYNVSLLAFHNLGLISNNVNFLFLRNDLAKYTFNKNSDTIIILDIYLPLIIDQLQASGVKKVILTSLLDYCPDNRKEIMSDISRMPKKIREVLLDPKKMEDFQIKLAALKGIEFIDMRDLIQKGRESKLQIDVPEVDIEKDSIYSYTSGTTAPPKSIVFKEQSPNAIIEMHKGLDMRDYIGDRTLVVIPASHATGMFYASYLQMAKGKTLVLQPIYDKNSFAKDLEERKINHTLAAASFYLAAVARSTDEKTDLSLLSRPCSGGEPISKSNVVAINEWLKESGCEEKIAIGGGSGEVGSSALTSYELDSNTKTNETGYPIPGVYVKIVDSVTGDVVHKGDRGIIHISSAAAADRYLDDDEATRQYYYVDDNGIRWANLGDIAIQNEDGSYNMLGRSSDNYVDKDGTVHYLFDIEYALEVSDPVVEWEISVFSVDSENYDVVAQVVLKKDYVGREDEVIEYLCKKYNLSGVKIYDSFEVSDVTGKRDYQLLKNDVEGYYYPIGNGKFYKKRYSFSSNLEKEVVDRLEVVSGKKKLLS